jgi:hypothetical protein
VSSKDARGKRQRTTMMSALFTWRSAISSPESGLTPTEHHVALTLSLHMNELGESCFPSVYPTQHEETCGRSPATIRTAINQLVELGWLRKTLRVGRGNSNEYEALIPAWYENHRREADYDADVAVRRLAAIAAATAAQDAAHDPSTDAPAREETRLTEAGFSETSDRAASGETRRRESANPPDPITKPTGDRRRERQEGVNEDDSSRTKDLKTSDPAAAEAPVTDRHVTASVMAIRGADTGSPVIVIPEAHGLPGSVFDELVERTVARRGGVGLLITFLRIARAERAAAFSAQLAAELGQHARPYAPPPWAVDALKRDRPERYTRIVAKTMPDELLREALGQHHRDVDDFVELARAVRAGSEPDDRVGSPEQELERWLHERAALAELPTAAELEQLLAGWRGLDDVDRERALELADTLRHRAAESGAEAA